MLNKFAYLLVVAFSLFNFNSIDYIYTFDYRVVAMIIFLFLSPMVFVNDTKKYNLYDDLYLAGSVLFIGLCYNL